MQMIRRVAERCRAHAKLYTVLCHFGPVLMDGPNSDMFHGCPISVPINRGDRAPQSISIFGCVQTEGEHLISGVKGLETEHR